MTDQSCNYNAVVWEWFHDTGKWRAYSPDVTNLLERSNLKDLRSVCLGDAEPNLSNYTVNLKDKTQISEETDRKRPVRRQLYSCQSPAAWGVSWQWNGAEPSEFHPYDMEVSCILEDSYRNGLMSIDLSNYLLQLNYTICLKNMVQINNRSGYQRSIRRIHTTPYVMIKTNTPNVFDFSPGLHVCPMSKSTSLRRRSHSMSVEPQDRADASAAPIVPLNHIKSDTEAITKIVTRQSAKNKTLDAMPSSSSSDSSDSIKPKKKCKSKRSDKSRNDSNSKTGTSLSIIKALSSPARALMHKIGSIQKSSVSEISKPTRISRYSSGNTSTSVSFTFLPFIDPCMSYPVPGVVPPELVNRSLKQKHPSTEQVDGKEILSWYSEEVELDDTFKESCCICCEALTSPSGYDENDTLVASLNRCQHMFHKMCMIAMHDSAQKPKYIQCPTCKIIYGEKTGNQPNGKMDYHVIPYSLNGYNADTIRIIYNIPDGMQTGEHPNPGKRYTARGFPRHCYLPNNEEGCKVLSRLITAWERRLIFTIGSSVTTGETDTVTWNEIHHKTEFGRNFTGHGYPDENYIDNVLMELAMQGIVD